MLETTQTIGQALQVILQLLYSPLNAAGEINGVALFVWLATALLLIVAIKEIGDRL